MGLKIPYKLKSFIFEVGGPSYGQNKNIGSREILTESPHKTLPTFFHSNCSSLEVTTKTTTQPNQNIHTNNVKIPNLRSTCQHVNL